MKPLQYQQLAQKLAGAEALRALPLPVTGWLNAIRTTLGITLEQVATRLGITKQSVQEYEAREREGTITVKSLREAAHALDMELVYALVPKDGSLDALIERRARKLAEQIVLRTSNTMKLEDQENSRERIRKAIEERAAQLKQEMPKALWD